MNSQANISASTTIQKCHSKYINLFSSLWRHTFSRSFILSWTERWWIKYFQPCHIPFPVVPWLWVIPATAHPYPGDGQHTTPNGLRCLMRKGQQWAGIGTVNMSSQEEESYPRIQKKRDYRLLRKVRHLHMCERPLAQGTRRNWKTARSSFITRQKQ